MAEEQQQEPHGRFGYVTCVPSELMDNEEFWDNVRLSLLGLVGLRIWELRDAEDDELVELGKLAASIIGSRGDKFQFPKDKKPSGVLAELVTGFAAAARLTDGGITAIGVHACFYPHEGCPKNKDR
ncbi:hypothetical protein ACLGIH_19810 [Streptomyces sp. HMX87]|uniref:hypothetical protein n=1 Tax=Streptomyces sp. HMX87 TaxID=3390849 RepID=UPI003A855BE1